MATTYLLLLIPFFSLAISVFFQILTFRLCKSMQRSYIIALFSGFIALIFFSALFQAIKPYETIAVLIANIIGFIGLWLCFVAVVGLGVSLRIRILYYLRRIGRPCLESEIEAFFEGKQLTQRRIDRLIAGGHIQKVENKLFSTQSWLFRVAYFNAFLKHFITGRGSEF